MLVKKRTHTRSAQYLPSTVLKNSFSHNILISRDHYLCFFPSFQIQDTKPQKNHRDLLKLTHSKSRPSPQLLYAFLPCMTKSYKQNCCMNECVLNFVGKFQLPARVTTHLTRVICEGFFVHILNNIESNRMFSSL